MRVRTKSFGSSHEIDMTPMIDMTFQLIAFFMFVLNFAEAEQSERITLPASELAKPPEVVPESMLTLQLTKEGTVLFAGDEVSIPGLKDYLVREAQVLRSLNKSPAVATIIIRADANAKTGQVQELIRVAQETGFETFALRAEQKDET